MVVDWSIVDWYCLCTVNKKGKVSFKRSEEVGVPPLVSQQSSKDSNESSRSGSILSETSTA